MRMENVPVIDVRSLEDSATLRALDAACREWGFFQIVSHGIDHAVFDALHREMRAFFAMPMEAKLAISRTAENPWGFYDRELTKNTLDLKQIYDYGRGDGRRITPQWPQACPSFEPAVRSFFEACEELALRLLSAVSINLGMPADHLRRDFEGPNSSFVRLNYYPLRPAPVRPHDLATAPVGHLGINPHTDAGALTLLLQDEQPGLEVLREDRWHLVEPRSDALVVNVGDIVQVWSNDRYRASLHRVRASTGAERYSAPFFFNPHYDSCFAPLATTVDPEHPARYRPINWGEFRSRRAAGDYRDYGEEVQIDHYRYDRDPRNSNRPPAKYGRRVITSFI